MKKLTTQERRNKILGMIVENGSVKNADLVSLFQVSAETIRKDMTFLEQQGLIRKLHGKAQILPNYIDAPIELRVSHQHEQKHQIAEAALEYIENNSVIYLDSGSTVQEIAKLLIQRENVLVITHSLTVANVVMRQRNSAYITGGFVDANTQITDGPCTIDSLQQFRPAIAFMGTNGIRYHNGPTTLNFNDIEMKNAVLDASAKNCIVCDSSKFSQGAIAQYASWSRFDLMITDAALPEELASRMTGLEIRIAGNP